VIIFVMLFSVIISAILDFASTGFKTTQAIAQVRDDQLAVDGAVDGAINALRGSTYAGFVGQNCPDFQYEPPSSTSDPEVTVSCRPVGGNSGGVDDPIPQYAVLTLGTLPSEGFLEDGTEELTIDGGIFSNGTISLGTSRNERLTVFGDALAVRPCVDPRQSPPRISATGRLQCDLVSQAADPLSAGLPDPGYPTAVPDPSGMLVDPAPLSCSSAEVVFQQGLYTENPKYLVPAGCNPARWRFFAPPGGLGVFYFDLPDADANLYQGKDIVAGTHDAAGVCTSGVQLILGGPTYLDIDAHLIDLCSHQAPGTRQEIGLYGLGAGYSRTQRTTVPPLEGSVASSTAFLNPSSAVHPDGSPVASPSNSANAALVGGSVEQAVIGLNGFNTAGSVPPGSTILGAAFKISHAETSAHVQPTAAFTIGSTTTSCPAITPTATSNLAVATCDITSKLSAQFSYRDLANTRLSFTANGAALTDPVVCAPNRSNCTPQAAESASAYVDGVVLEVSYIPPGFESHRCMVGFSSCEILYKDRSATSFFRGTIYTPTGAIFADVHNFDETVFGRGVIARTIATNASASSHQDNAAFQVPGLTGTRVVLFEASVGGRAKLRAKVRYTDTTNGTGLPGYLVKVLSWVVLP
ncbi:MAG: hypothetical protein JWN29_2757, partial [Acidimicrobiales bacterium]|nr:hypothetical protein [Acidimicrobiales bacterium]